MNAPVLSRRHLLGATAAVGACALPAVAEAQVAALAPDHPDAALLALIERFDASRAAWDATDELVAEAMNRAIAAMPSRPEALQFRAEDFPRSSYGAGAADPCGEDGVRWYGARGVEWLRKAKPHAHWTADDGARRREIVGCFDAWLAESRAARDAVGVAAAERAEADAAEAWNAADDAVKLYQPRTLAGLARKAAWVAGRLSIGNCDDDLGEVFARQVAAFGGAAS